MMQGISVWLIDADKHDHASIRWSVARSPFPVDLCIFTTADAAMEALPSQPIRPHLIITDMKLVGASGMEFLRWIKQSAFAEIPVIVRCASADLQDIAAAYDAGANAYVIKAHDLHLIDRNISGIAAFFGRLPRCLPVREADSQFASDA